MVHRKFVSWIVSHATFVFKDQHAGFIQIKVNAITCVRFYSTKRINKWLSTKITVMLLHYAHKKKALVSKNVTSFFHTC